MTADIASYSYMVDKFLAEYDRLSAMIANAPPGKTSLRYTGARDRLCLEMASRLDAIPALNDQNHPSFPDVQLSNSDGTRLIYRDFVVAGRPRKNWRTAAFNWMRKWDPNRLENEQSLRDAIKVALMPGDPPDFELPSHRFGLEVLWTVVVASTTDRDRLPKSAA